MINFKKILLFIILPAILLVSIVICVKFSVNRNNTPKTGSIGERPSDSNNVQDIEVDENVHHYTMNSEENGNYVYQDEEGNLAEFSILYISGTENCYTVSDNTLTFSNITGDSVYSITGTFYGNIIIDVGENYKFELEMMGFKLTSYYECPITIESGDQVTLSAKKGTENYIYDLRDEVGEEDISSSIYAMCDLDIQGKGELNIKSINNNGIHTKDDLNIKNLNLQVDCKDNALKGNDSVTIESGQIILIARTGDGIKTTNTDLSSKGNQRGTVTISGGDILIYAACDGIDAAYDVVINEDVATPVIQIYTDKYSKYSEEVTTTEDSMYYIRFSSVAYQYSIRYFNDDTYSVWYNSSSYKTINAGMNHYYYYPITKPSGYNYMQLYIYSSSQEQGQSDDYIACSDTLTVNHNYDTIALQNRNGSLSLGWTNYSTVTSMGGMNNGNTEKGDHSTKGIKADNAIIISSGTIQISSYDDSIHVNSDATLENGDSPLGNVTISGGTLSLYTNDDGIHADGILTLSGGVVVVACSYEGIEGKVVNISGGNISVIASDDGINGTSTSGESIIISGGTLYVYAGGDGLDSNSTASYDGLLISGGYSVIISTGASDSSIDTERGYKYTGGYVLGISSSGGMSSESVNSSPSFSFIGSKSTLSLTKGNYLVVEDYVTVELPIGINASVVFLGSTDVSIKSTSSSKASFDSNGIYWNISY